MKEILDLLKEYNGAITALAAIVGVVITGIYTYITRRLANIAVQQRDIIALQHKLQTAQVKYMLYERRLKIFAEVLGFVDYVLREEIFHAYGMASISEFNKKIQEGQYIFGNDIQDYISELQSNAKQLLKILLKYKTDHSEQVVSEQEHLADEQEKNRLHTWFASQNLDASEKFAPYLKIED